MNSITFAETKAREEFRVCWDLVVEQWQAQHCCANKVKLSCFTCVTHL
jgi:hypothetical protein